ncbi:MAG: class I SAM-dependent methyltransferase [Atribacterota bacterium]
MKLYNKIRKAIVREDLSKGFISSKVRKKAGERLKTNYRKGDKILYVGCGEGLFLLPSAKKYTDSIHVGMDNWKKVIDYTRQRLIVEGIENVRLKLSSGDSLPFDDGSFNHVFFLNAVHNQKSIKEVKNIIKEMLRVCAGGGKVYFDIRNKNNLIFRLFYRSLVILDSTKPIIKLQNKKIVKKIIEDMQYKEINFFPIDIFRTGYLAEITKQL